MPSPLLGSASSSMIFFSACCCSSSSGEALLLPRTSYHHHIFSRRRHKSLRSPPPSLLFATDDNDQATSPNNRAGSYIDLGTITFNEASYNNDSFLQNLFTKSQHHNNDPITPPLPSSSNNNNDITQWRSKHWIVLIDDEPSIRLAIGDYLHSMGYSTITACDGPQSFLDVLLYSCGWSLLMNRDDDNIDDDIDNSDIDNGGRSAVPPPWIDNETSSMMWRLPNCIISDIRMPGGVDGVQLLELLRERVDDTNSSDSSEDDVKKGRRRSSKKDQRIRSNNEYDGKDDFELLDAIVGSSSGSKNDDGGTGPTATGAIGKQSQTNQDAGKIVTAIDQAKQKLTVIRDTLTYHQEEEAASNKNNNNNSLQQQQQQQYPTSLLQIPVILLTAKAMVSDRIVGFKAGANNYLPKPFRPEELLGMVDSLLRKQERERKKWRNRNANALGGGGSIEDEVVDDGRYIDELAMMYSASAQQIKDLTAELVEIKNLLKEEAQRETNIKVEQEEMERLTKLLPNALWMFLNNDRRNRLFTKDHIRSILLFCFNDASLARRKSTVTRDELLIELERLNDEDPDILKNFLSR
jgi:DNA-binding response OmpR family regulator